MKKLTVLQSTAPREIWLQVSDEHQDNAEPFPKDAEGVTWCQDSVLACEVRYVRADLERKALTDATADELRAALRELVALADMKAHY